MRFLTKSSHAKKSSIKLSIKDRKLIQLLFQNARTPITQLSKKVGVSKPAIIQKIHSLQKKGVLTNLVLLTKVNSNQLPIYLFEISTLTGAENEKISEKLMKIEESITLFWYNGYYNLLIGFNTDKPQEIFEKIEEIIDIKKIRIRKIIDNWFHTPHVFNDVPDKRVNFKRVIVKIDEKDRKILKALDENPLASFTEITTKTKFAIQTVKNHLDYLKNSGIIISNYFLPDVWLCDMEWISMNFIVKGKD